MEGTEGLAKEDSAKPPCGILDPGFKVADGGVTSNGFPSAVGKGGETLLIDDFKGHPHGLDDDLELEIGEGEGLTLLSRGNKDGAVSGGIKETLAEFFGKGIDREVQGSGGGGREGGVGAREEATGSGGENGGGGDDGREKVVEFPNAVPAVNEGFEVGRGDGKRDFDWEWGRRGGKKSKG